VTGSNATTSGTVPKPPAICQSVATKR